MKKLYIYKTRKEAFTQACKLMLCIVESGWVSQLSRSGGSAQGTKAFTVATPTLSGGTSQEVVFEYKDGGVDEYTDEILSKNAAGIVPIEIDEKNEKHIAVEDLF